MPPDVWRALPASPRQLIAARHRLGRGLAHPHLPQGAPSSPALANLVAFRLDRRLSGLAATFGASYSRYADDLAFSGSAGVLRCAPQLRGAVGAIAREEGFVVNERKSTVATRAGRQELCGIVVNDHPNMRRAEYDTLRAILHNAVRSGPTSQNRSGLSDFRSHLSGRIAWVEQLDAARGHKLRREFSRIAWPGRHRPDADPV